MPPINPIFPPILIPIGCLIALGGSWWYWWLRRRWMSVSRQQEWAVLRDYLVASLCLIVLGLFCILLAILGQ